MPLVRKCDSAYVDGHHQMAVRGVENPSPRMISNALCAESSSQQPKLSSAGLTDMIWGWGQFIDHEIDLTDTGSEDASMTTPSREQDPREVYPGRTIPFTRSVHIEHSDPREHPNDISSFIDGTNVYGNGAVRAMALRRLDGSGKLKTSYSSNGREILLPRNDRELDMANAGGASSNQLFMAGDVRANENALLTSLHTVFLREHNFQCDVALRRNPQWRGKDEMIYQQARRMVIGMMQAVTYNEFLPALLGSRCIPAYSGYNDNLDAGIAVEFSTAGYRFGHSAVSSQLQTGLDSTETVGLRDVFFHPEYLHENGADGILLGATRKVMREINSDLVDDLRNFLFGPPSRTQLLDLAALNIQRGRDHGLPGYNEIRRGYNLAVKTQMSEVTSNAHLAARLEVLYGSSPAEIDPWVGCLVEDHHDDGGGGTPPQVGELARAIMRDQFIRLRDGDRFWYENDTALDNAERETIRRTRLSDILRRNTQWNSSHIRDDVFHTTGTTGGGGNNNNN